MRRELMPLPCKPWMLNGISERLIVSHYENEYGAAVRSLNAIRDALTTLDLDIAPGYQIRAMKQEELAMRGSVVLHELYFGSLGGDGGARFTGSGPGVKVPDHVAVAIEQQFGSMLEWRREFLALARALGGGPGWVVLSHSSGEGRLQNHILVDHTHAMLDATPLLALDLYEHAYHMDFGANAAAYVDAFLRNIDWSAVNARMVEASGPKSATRVSDGRDDAPASISVEELSDALATSGAIQVLDARPKHYFSRGTDMMQGATWRDPDRIDEWSTQLSRDAPIVVYCAYGFSVGCDVAAKLRERGYDARYVRGGLAAWYAAGGERALKPRS